MVNKEDQTFQRKLELCSGEIHEYLDRVEQKSVNATHKEEAASFRKTYMKHCGQVYNMMTVNPFQATQFQKIDSPMMFPTTVEMDCQRLFDLGKVQYKDFVRSRFVLGTKDVIKTTIPRNNLKLPKNWVSEAVYSPQIKLSPSIITKLQAACESRAEPAKKIFEQEFTNVPECFIDKEGKPFHSSKSELFKTLIPSSENVPRTFDGLIVDVSVIVRSLATVINTSNFTYIEFVNHVLRYIEDMAVKIQASRLDIVFDSYLNNSIKSATRQGRGMAGRVIFQEGDQLPENLQEFLLNSDNKTNLNHLFQKQASNPIFWQWPGEVVTTYGKKVWSRHDGVKELGTWIDQVHEEADNRMLIHAKDMLDAGLKSINVRTADTDVIVIFLSYYLQFKEYASLSSIWIEFGKKDSKRFISLANAYNDLGESLCLAMPFFFAFCGCDSTTSFFKKTSSYMFQIWMANSEEAELTATFQQLSWQPSMAVVEASYPVIQRFVNYCYGYGGLQFVDEVRYKIFKSSVSGNLRELPPCLTSLKLHVLRSAYQSGWVWGNTLSQSEMPAINDWGWTINPVSNTLQIQWYKENLNTGQITLLDLLKTCKCKKTAALCTNCNCAKQKFACLKFCNCKGSCIKS